MYYKNSVLCREVVLYCVIYSEGPVGGGGREEVEGGELN